MTKVLVPCIPILLYSMWMKFQDEVCDDGDTPPPSSLEPRRKIKKDGNVNSNKDFAGNLRAPHIFLTVEGFGTGLIGLPSFQDDLVVAKQTPVYLPTAALCSCNRQ
jgi:hypothetical protein